MCTTLRLTARLIEANQPLAIESIQSVCLMLDGQPAVADARVRHVNAPPLTASAISSVLNSLPPPSAFLDAVDRLVAFRAFPTELA